MSYEDMKKGVLVTTPRNRGLRDKNGWYPFGVYIPPEAQIHVGDVGVVVSNTLEFVSKSRIWNGSIEVYWQKFGRIELARSGGDFILLRANDV